MERFVRIVPTAVIAAALLALLLAWTVTDAVPYVATLHYALQMPVVAGALVLVGSGSFVVERFRRALVCAVLVAACVVTQRTHAFVGNGDLSRDATGLRVLLWNVQGGRRGWDDIADTIAAQRPDVVCLVEPFRRYGDGTERIAARLPGYRHARVEERFLVFARGSVEPVEPLRSVGRAVLAALRVTVDGTPLTVLCADVHSNPLSPRGPVLRRLAGAAAPFADAPALLLGDFNTPRTSVHFADLRTHWSHAFEVAGNGPDVTWPDPLPVLALDHVWASPSVAVRSCAIVRSHASDHFPVLVTVERGP